MPDLIQNFSIAVAFACIIFSLHMFTVRSTNRTSSIFLGATFFVFAVQSGLLVLLLEHGKPQWVTVLRPALAMTIGPFVFLYLKSTAEPAFTVRAFDLTHFAPAILIGLELQTGFFLIDIDLAIIMSLGAYAVIVGLMIRRGAGQFAHLGNGTSLMFRVLVAVAALLTMSVVSEILIYLDIVGGGALGTSAPLFLMVTINLLVAGTVILLALHRPSPFEWQYVIAGRPNLEPSGLSIDECGGLITAFEQLVATDGLHTAERQNLGTVAKRLGVSQRHLSQSINQIYGESYSRRMNRLRVNEAKKLIRTCPDKSMTEILFEAGFRTKSSFNREFGAIEGCTPTQYRDSI